MTARRLWPLGVALLVVVIHVPYLWPGGPWARRPIPLVLGQDEGTVVYDSHRIDTGQVMYRDFFEFQGPVFYYLHAALFGATGGPSLVAARVLGGITTAVGAALLALLVARFAGRAAGIGAALIHACLLVPMWPFDYPHWLAETLALGGLLLATRDEPRPRDHVGAGILCALSAFTIQSVGIPVLVAAVGTSIGPGVAARAYRRALAPPLRLLAGAAIPTVIVAAYFAAHRALDDLVYAMFVWPLTHYSLGQGAATRYAWGTAEVLREHGQALHGLGLALAGFSVRVAFILPPIALVAAVPAAIGALRRIWRRDTEGWGRIVAAGAALAAVSPLWLAPVRPDLVHVAFLGSFGLVGAAVLAAPLRGRAARAMVATAFCAVGAAVAASYALKTIHTWPASRAMGDWREESLKLGDARRLDQLAGPEDTIVVGAMGGFYYLYVRPAAVPNTYIPATLPLYLSEEQWQRIADDIVDRRPAALLLVGKQWDEIRKRRPELARIYRRSGGLLLRDSTAAADSPSPNKTQSGTASGGE